DAALDLAYFLEFNMDTTAAANIRGEWSPEFTISYRPFAERPRWKTEGSMGDISFDLVSDLAKGDTMVLNFATRGISNDWFSRFRLRSVIQTEKGLLSDSMTKDMWMYPKVLNRYDTAPPQFPGPPDVIGMKDELGLMIVGLFEFVLGEERGALEFTRSGGKYFARLIFYSGEISESPLLITHIYEPLKKLPNYTIASVDLSFRAYLGADINTKTRRPTIVKLLRFDGTMKHKTTLDVDTFAYAKGNFRRGIERIPFEIERIDREPNILPDRRDYIRRLDEERLVNSAASAFKIALGLFNCINSEDWGPGLELSKMPSYENKRFIARRCVRMSGIVDTFPECSRDTREQALNLRFRLFTEPATVFLLKNEDLACTVRVPVLNYIFMKTEATLEYYTMKTEFTNEEIERIKSGLLKGAALLFDETYGYFAPEFSYYHELPGAKELPPVAELGKGMPFLGKKTDDENFYLLLEQMMQYTSFPNIYTDVTDYVDRDKFEAGYFDYPVIFVFGKVDTKDFRKMAATRSASDPKFKDPKIVTGVAFTRGYDRGKPAYAHIVLDVGFKESDLLEIVHWAMTLIMLDAFNLWKKQLPMEYLKNGDELFPDPWKPIVKYKADLGNELWWNVFLNVYWSYGLKKMFCNGRRPYYFNTAMANPQLLGDFFTLGTEERYRAMLKAAGK
ncbi:MAG: hypothetical protein WC712_02605, partial [Candidatus Brocadiia bacterium]